MEKSNSIGVTVVGSFIALWRPILNKCQNVFIRTWTRLLYPSLWAQQTTSVWLSILGIRDLIFGGDFGKPARQWPFSSHFAEESGPSQNSALLIWGLGGEGHCCHFTRHSICHRSGTFALDFESVSRLRNTKRYTKSGRKMKLFRKFLFWLRSKIVILIASPNILLVNSLKRVIRKLCLWKKKYFDTEMAKNLQNIRFFVGLVPEFYYRFKGWNRLQN